jgi:hypothetical protein
MCGIWSPEAEFKLRLVPHSEFRTWENFADQVKFAEIVDDKTAGRCAAGLRGEAYLSD